MLFLGFAMAFLGCQSFGVDRATIASVVFTRSHKAVAFDDNQSIGFYATNGYWQLDLKRLVGDDSIYKIGLVDNLSQSYEFTLQSLRECTPDVWYPGCTRKGLFLGVSMRESNTFKKRVNFSCESLAFDSDASLVYFLTAPWQSERARKLVSAEGLLICIDTQRDDTMIDTSVEVIQLLVNGQPPSVELLKPYANGILRWHQVDGDVKRFFENIQRLEY